MVEINNQGFNLRLAIIVFLLATFASQIIDTHTASANGSAYGCNWGGDQCYVGFIQQYQILNGVQATIGTPNNGFRNSGCDCDNS